MGSTSGGDPLPEDAEIRCWICSGVLYFLPDSYPVAFHCDRGHFYTLRDLLKEEPAGGSAAAMIDYWRKKARLLYELAKRALRSGHAFVAADFQETADLIQELVSQREALQRRNSRN